MKKTVNFFRGSARVVIEMAYPERLMNLCAKNGIEFWDPVLLSETEISVFVPLRDLMRLKKTVTAAGNRVLKEQKTGAPVTVSKVRKRVVLLLGLLLSVIGVMISGLFVWDIQVSGNETVSSEAILSELRSLGVGIGMCRLTYNQSYVSNEMLLRLTRLCWLTVNFQGSRAMVLVREETPPPQVPDLRVPGKILAGKAGVITKMTVRNGKALVRKGDTVNAGDVLVSGQMDSISRGSRYVRADGDVLARTWYSLSSCAPLPSESFCPTGEKNVRYAIALGDFRINLYFPSGNWGADCDTILREEYVPLPGGWRLPIRIIRREAERRSWLPFTGGQEDLTEQMEEDMRERLQSSIEGNILKETYSCRVENGVLTLQGDYECEENVSVLCPMGTEEINTGEMEAYD